MFGAMRSAAAATARGLRVCHRGNGAACGFGLGLSKVGSSRRSGGFGPRAYHVATGLRRHHRSSYENRSTTDTVVESQFQRSDTGGDAMTKLNQDVILFTYDISVFGRKIDWYLTLRGLKYVQCEQPNRMPRPDLEALGIRYRRIPILAIGRDIYIDTRLIIEKLERLLPNGALGSKNPFEQGLEKILQTWSMDGGPFWRTAQCIPDDLDVMNDPEWIDDRSEMISQKFDRHELQKVRPEAMAHQRLHIETLEHGLLANGRKFVLETETPSLADIHAIWTFDWLTGDSMHMGEHLDQEVISSCQYPKLYAWIDRFRDAVEAAEAEHGAPGILSSKACIKQILGSEYWEREGTVDELDPLGLKKGQMVEVFPTDSGFAHRDVGELVSLCKREVVIQSEVKHGDGYLRLHFPRINFRIQPIGASG